MKYIDDLSYVHSLDLKKCLKKNTDMNFPRPLSYHDRTEHYLPESESVIQTQVNKLNRFAEDMDMKINKEKSKVMIFNTSRTFDFLPRITIDCINYLEVVEEMKLLGIIFQSNMNMPQWVWSAGVCLN